MNPATPVLIAHLVHRFGVGGLESVVLELIRRLPPEGFRHMVIALTEVDPAMVARLPAGVTVHELHKRPGKDWPVWWRLWTLLRRLRPAVLHSCNIATLEGALPAWLAGVGVRIHAEHGRDMYDLDGSNPTYRRLRRLYAPLIHAFVPVSRELETWLVREVGIPPAKVRFIPNGVDLDRFCPGLPPPPELPAGFRAPGTVVFGTVGRLAPVKDQATLLRAFQRLRQRFPDRPLRLLLVGDGPLRGELTALAGELGLGPEVLFAGEQAEIPVWLGAMDVFVLSSLAEGMPLTLLEAMGCGLPMVTTRGGDCPLLVHEEENGLLVEVGDVAGLARAMGRYLETPELAKAHGVLGRARVEAAFSLETTVARYQQLLASFIAG